MLPVSRDDDDYRWGETADHNWQGLYIHGPAGDDCALGRIIEISKLRLRVTASSPDAQRRRRVVYESRSIARIREQEPDYTPVRFMLVGGYLKPAGKRPTSGRKRRVAA